MFDILLNRLMLLTSALHHMINFTLDLIFYLDVKFKGWQKCIGNLLPFLNIEKNIEKTNGILGKKTDGTTYV